MLLSGGFNPLFGACCVHLMAWRLLPFYAGESRELNGTLVIIVAVFAVLVAVGLGQQGHRVQSTRLEDLLAANACAEFNQVTEDVGAGVITDSELKARLQKVFDMARLAEQPMAKQAFHEFQRAWVGTSDNAKLRGFTHVISFCHTPLS